MAGIFSGIGKEPRQRTRLFLMIAIICTSQHHLLWSGGDVLTN